MKRKMIAILCALLVLQGLSATSFALAAPTYVPMHEIYSSVSSPVGSGFMWDSEGNFLDRETFEDQIDQWIEDGVVVADDKDAYLAQYDYCAEYGGATGTRGTGMVGIRGGMGGAGRFMWDSEGNFLDRDSFENQLDQWITDGQINTENKDAYLAQYDYCAEYGGGSSGTGGTRGTGMMGIRGGNTDPRGNGMNASRGGAVDKPDNAAAIPSNNSTTGPRSAISAGSGSSITSGSRGSSITGSRSNGATGTRGNGAGSMGPRGNGGGRSGGNGGGSGGAGRSGGGGRGMGR